MSLRPYSSGGNACALLETTYKMIRVVPDKHVYGYEIQKTLQKEHENIIPSIDSISFYEKDLPANVVEALNADPDCKQKLIRWREYNKGYTVVKMEFASGGTFDMQVFTDPLDLKRVALKLYAFLYRAQVDYQFEHNDIKGDNIVFKNKQNKISVMLIDFDSSTFRALSAPTNRYGHLYYKAPERLDNGEHVFGANDVWALGIMLLSKYMNTMSLLILPGETSLVSPLKVIQRLLSIRQLLKCEKVNHPMGIDEESDRVYKILYRYKFENMDPDARSFFCQVLEWDPYKRILNGRVHRLLHYPFLDVPGRDEFLKANIYSHYDKNEPLPMTIVRTLIQSGIVDIVRAHRTLACFQCKKTTGQLYLASDASGVFCSDACSKK